MSGVTITIGAAGAVGAVGAVGRENEGRNLAGDERAATADTRSEGRALARAGSVAHGALVLLLGTLTALPGATQILDAAGLAEDAPGAELMAPAVPSALAQFTTAVEDREPIDQVTFVSNDVRKIFFFSDLRGLQGHSVTHRWLHDGEVMAEVQFDVRGPRWRVWSSKELLPDWLGDWTVEIVTDEGEVIAAETFTYSAPAA